MLDHPRDVYLMTLFVIGMALAAMAAHDLYFYLKKQPTITFWLRANPEWFVIPAIIVIAIIVGVALHLFVFNLMK